MANGWARSNSLETVNNDNNNHNIIYSFHCDKSIWNCVIGLSSAIHLCLIVRILYSFAVTENREVLAQTQTRIIIEKQLKAKQKFLYNLKIDNWILSKHTDCKIHKDLSVSD